MTKPHIYEWPDLKLPGTTVGSTDLSFNPIAECKIYFSTYRIYGYISSISKLYYQARLLIS